MLPENRAFMIRGDDDQEYGPVDLNELREWVRENRAGLGTTVRLDEPGAMWHPWQYYPELVALLAEVHVTSPIPGRPDLVIAPLGRRFLALLMDLILSSFLATPLLVVVVLAYMPDWNEQFTYMLLNPQAPMSPHFLHYVLLGNIITYLTLTLYMAGFHAIHGRTPGKSMLRLRVVDQNGNKPPFVKSFLRALAFVFSFYLYCIPLTYAFFNPQRRTFHDLIAGTYVVEA